jgi:hypothetical protein
MVVPELRRRGLFRTEFESVTLRDNFGWGPVKSRYNRHHPAADWRKRHRDRL